MGSLHTRAGKPRCDGGRREMLQPLEVRRWAPVASSLARSKVPGHHALHVLLTRRESLSLAHVQGEGYQTPSFNKRCIKALADLVSLAPSSARGYVLIFFPRLADLQEPPTPRGTRAAARYPWESIRAPCPAQLRRERGSAGTRDEVPGALPGSFRGRK